MHKRIRNSIILFALLILILTSFYIFHPKLKVGIIGVDNVSQYNLEISKLAFDNHYSDYFKTNVLNERLSSQNIRTNNSFYLNSDFFREIEKTNLHQEYDLDYILIVTEHKIKDWDEKGSGIWGQADTKTNSALITTLYFENNNLIIQNHATHEILHLLGFLHNVFDKSGIMQYTNNQETNLCTYYAFQMPIRTSMIKLFPNKGFLLTVYVMNFITSLIFFLGFMGLNELLYYYDEKKLNLKKRSFKIDILSSLLFFIFGIFYNYIFSIFALPILFLIGMHLLREKNQ
jgi:hypothetical protein